MRDELNEMASDLRDGAEVTAADIEKIRKDAGKAASLMTGAVREFNGTAKDEIENCASYLADTADQLIQTSGDLSSILGVDGIKPDQSLPSLGVDSILAVELKNKLDAQWSMNLPVFELTSGKTVLAQLGMGTEAMHQGKPLHI